jgi:hypothetical protein
MNRRTYTEVISHNKSRQVRDRNKMPPQHKPLIAAQCHHKVVLIGNLSVWTGKVRRRAGSPADAPETSPGRNSAPSFALARSRGGLSGVGHPGFVAFAAVAPTIPMTVPTFSAVTSRKFGGSTGWLSPAA